MKKSEKVEILRQVKDSAGNHSPSKRDVVSALGYSPFKYDFCFLSNPYATDLLVNWIARRLRSEEEWFEVLEAYPADQSFVAKKITCLQPMNPESLVVCNGAIQAIEWVCSGWGIESLFIPTPTFSTYYELLPGRYSFGPDFWLSGDLTAKSLIDTFNASSSDTLLLIYPNNPSGECLTIDEFTGLLEYFRETPEQRLIVDESFCHFLDNYHEYAQISGAIKSRNVAFVKSMSKAFDMAGLRLGYLRSNDDGLLEFARGKSTWNLNNVAILASEAFESASFRENYEVARLRYNSLRNGLFQQLNVLEGYTVYPSQANFFLLHVDFDCPDIVSDLLLDYGIYTRTMSDKVGLDETYIRVACRREEENAVLVEALKEIYETHCDIRL